MWRSPAFDSLRALARLVIPSGFDSKNLTFQEVRENGGFRSVRPAIPALPQGRTDTNLARARSLERFAREFTVTDFQAESGGFEQPRQFLRKESGHSSIRDVRLEI